MTEKQKDYWDKIMQEKKFENSQKISESTETLSESELEEEMISIKSTTILRILIKWCEGLENNMKLKKILMSDRSLF